MNTAIAPDTDAYAPSSSATPTAGPAACAHRCRFCDAPLSHLLVDLGTTPLCESFRTAEQLSEPEPAYPLQVFVCESCLLAQVPEYVGSEAIFSEYAYFSSYSDSYLDHARQNVAALIERFHLTRNSRAIELASNDGYLLRNFVERGIPCLGVEPAANIAAVAKQRGIPTLVKFFGERTAQELVSQGQQADLLIANNVLAHVPELNDFVRGMKLLLAADGVAVVEVQHLLRLMQRNQFDTIYHEHFCYFTLLCFQRVLAAQGLTVFDVEEIATHGGSLRYYIKHAKNSALPIVKRVGQIAGLERAAGLHELTGYHGFTRRVAEVKHKLRDFLTRARQEGKTVAGYGAPGKANTLLNYCGIGRELLPFTVDRNPYKHGKFLPGSQIPIFSPERLAATQPDYVLVLPWNLKDEIAEQLAYIRDWGGKLVVPIPELQVW